MSWRSQFVPGLVTHARHSPRTHRLRYGVFSLLVDLDELPALNKGLRFFGHNRRAVFSFHDADHGDLDGTPLRPWVERQLADAGIEATGGRIDVLCYPRILGYAFNPLTVFFCRDADGHLAGILYEVSNTFGERHTYVIPASGEGPRHRHSCDKDFYVSPFMPMDCRYHFRIEEKEKRILVAINETICGKPVLYAAFAGERQELSAGALAKAFFLWPLMGLKVIGAIHYEALKLWLKGFTVFYHEPAESRAGRTLVGKARR